jgi:quinol monooxygenase YgiN
MPSILLEREHTMPLTVIAKFEAKPGMESKVKEGLQGMVAPSRAEEGCLSYDVFQSNDNPAITFTYENWTGKDALDAHMQTPYFKALDAQGKETLAKPMEISLLTQV